MAIEARFWAKVNRESGHRVPYMDSDCWLWTASKNSGGYGKFYLQNANGRKTFIDAHRLSWQLANGREPGDLQVMHRCDNRACVRPEHLSLGTGSDNARDCIAKGRNPQNIARTHCPEGHELDEANTYLRKNRRTGEVARVCRTCGRAKTKEWERRRREADPDAALTRSRAKWERFKSTHPDYESPAHRRRKTTSA